MADDNHSRYRSNDPFARGAAPAAPNNDPLAELARLIGQNNDALSDYGRPPAQPSAPRYGNGPGYGQEPPHYGAAPMPSHGYEPPRYSADPEPPLRYSGDPEPHYGQDDPSHYGYEPRFDAAPRYEDDPPRYADDQAPHNDWHNGGTPPADRPDDQFALPLRHPAPLARPYSNPDYGNQDYSGQGYASQDHASPGYTDQPGQPAPSPDSYRPERSDFDPSYPDAAPDRQGYSPPLYPTEPGTGAMPPPHDDEFYDDAPRGRGRSFLAVVAVLVLAVIGTAGAFGYRSLFGGSGAPATPPVIRASSEPSKVAPPPAPDQSAAKFTYDRFGDAGKDEQIVRRDEKPLDLSKLTPPPPAASPAPSATRPQSGATANAANPPSAIGDPRRVRTVPIRPNQPDAAAATPSIPNAPAPSAPPQQSAVAANEPPQPMELAPQPAPRAAAPSARPTPREARPARTPAQASGAPLSLSPDTNNSLPPPSTAQDRAPPRAAAPARVATAPAAISSGGGSYLVQVSSQKSEADAESSYRGISSKYSSVLGGKPHTVRRADLGSKGVYYRAMIGPFASREDAVQLCTSLKQAGGDCVVQH